MAELSDIAVDVRGLCVDRGGNPVLHDLDLVVPTGAITGLLGPSGCGKTTLMRSIVGVQIVRSGTVTVLGEPAGSRQLRDRVGYVTQAPSVYGDLSVAENLRYFARVLGVGPERIDHCIDTVGLGAFRGRVVSSLSGGERARVSLATALLNNPPVLVLDEPTVGLDPVLREELWATFAGLAEQGATLMVSSHVMDEASRCDTLLLMREGRILAADTPQSLLERTSTSELGDAFLALIRDEARTA
ncbi:MAG: ABC transporter ATP-binding protein [Gaiellales bacterium]